MQGTLNLREQYLAFVHRVSGLEGANIQSGACPDQWVGSIDDSDSNAQDFPFRQCPKRLDDSPHILLILESPHLNEFVGNCCPAKGATGHQLRKFIGEIVEDLGVEARQLTLINAIHYQCSLGKPTKEYRDLVFRFLWEHGGSFDFENRLMEIYRSRDVLLNCCTGGNSITGLRRLVTESIRNSLGELPIYSGPHPCSWFSTRNRRLIGLLPTEAHLNE